MELAPKGPKSTKIKNEYQSTPNYPNSFWGDQIRNPHWRFFLDPNLVHWKTVLLTVVLGRSRNSAVLTRRSGEFKFFFGGKGVKIRVVFHPRNQVSQLKPGIYKRVLHVRLGVWYVA